MLSNRGVRTLVFLGVAAGALAAGWALRDHHRYKHFAVHDPGLVYRSAWLEADVLDEVIEKHQLRTVVNLCYPGELGEPRWEGERRVVTNAGARLIELPMPFTLEVDDATIRKHVDLMQNPDNYPMLVHCQHGVTRTSKFLAIYDVLFQGMSAEESLARQPLFGRDEHNVQIQAFARRFDEERERYYPRTSANPRELLRH